MSRKLSKVSLWVGDIHNEYFIGDRNALAAEERKIAEKYEKCISFETANRKGCFFSLISHHSLEQNGFNY